MRLSEAEWISARLAELPHARCSPVLNLGSSTAEFRERRQPHIDRLIFAPLRAAGVPVIHADLKRAAGVDIAGDVLLPQVQDELRRRRPKVVLSSNLLEHVHDRDAFARAMVSLLEPGGLVIVTVPHSYPFHADPIDTGFRPTPDELAGLFPTMRRLRGEIVEDVTYAHDLWRRGPRRALRSLLGALRLRGDVARAQRDSLRWLARPFSTSCVVLEAR